MITITCGLVIKADANNDAEARQEAICVVRLVMNDFYDFVDELRGITPEVTELRNRLDRAIPQGDCPR